MILKLLIYDNLLYGSSDRVERSISLCTTDHATSILPDQQTITENTVNQSVTTTFTSVNVKCYGGSTGAIDITVSGGTNYTFSWTASAGGVIPSGQANNEDLTGLLAGTYTVSVFDNGVLDGTTTVVITAPNAALSVSISQTDVKCKGDATGSVVITPAGGTAPYVITPAQIGLSAGLHTFTVTDINLCTTTVNVTITEPAAPLTAVVTSQTNVKCNGDATGSAVITPAGGTAPYVINPAQTALSAGSHIFTVTDANLCTTTVNVTITEPAAPLSAVVASQINVKCKGDATGSAVISPTGGSAPYVITPAQTALSAGSHTFTVTDANLCTTTVNVTITEPAAPLSAVVSSQSNVKCKGDATGSVVITPTGGTGPYVITPAQTSLSAGAHTFTVTDTNLCTTTVNVTITEPAAPLSAVLTSQINVKCKGDATGSAVITPSGGTAPYVITPAQTGLSAGAHTFTVTDASLCSTTVNVAITEPAALSAVLTSQINVNCKGDATGSAVIAPSGGTAPYTISPVQTGLSAGLHTFTVTDANLCTTTINVTITEPAAPLTFNSPVINDVTCSGKNDGTIAIIASGGTGTITYSINPTIGSQSPAGTFSNLSAQGYTITGTDQNGCTKTTSVTVGTIPDVTPPVISGCPGNIIVSTGPGNTLCSQTATWTEPSAIDNCIGAITFTTRSHAPGSTFPVGVTTVNYTFKDASNNTGACSFTITVTDDTPPTFTPPNNITIFSDASGNYNAPPAITGMPFNLADNCSLGAIQPTFSDGARTYDPACSGTSTIIRTWSLTDAHNNTTTHQQTITIADNIKPELTVPPTANIECTASTLPANTGQATATDNGGGTISITHTDVTVNGNCAGRSTITRTWTATDCSGNSVTSIQTINTQDTQPPVITCTSFSVANPNLIPASDANVNISATDNCGGPIEFVLNSEQYTGLTGTAGFCPKTVIRKYVARDQCGNTSTECTQVITVVDLSGCAVCQNTVPFFPAILDGRPDSLWISPSVVRKDLCCGAVGPPPPRCISFNVYLDKDAVGLIFDIRSGAKPSGSLFYQVDCGPETPVGGVICLAGGRFYTVTFCKPGNNQNTYSIQSISGITGQSGLVTRADANCAGQLSFTGADPSTVVWTVKTPNDQSLLHYLSCTHCMNPIFTPDSLAPPQIIYTVCGTLLGTNKCGNVAMTDCKDVTVTILPAIKINFNINPGNICANNIPTINAAVTPANLNYQYQWFNGFNGTGAILSPTANWTPTKQGPYSLKVTETQSGVLCNTAIHNFEIKFDSLAPGITAPPLPLNIECNDPNAPQQITNWLATAKASDGITSIPVTNNYNGITMACGTTLTVIFSASDICGNIGSVSSTIHVVDTTRPVITCPAVVSTVTDNNHCYATGVALGTPAATDNCAPPVLTNNAPVQFPVGTTVVTWTATDACGNTATCTQNVTVTDNQPPVLTCPAPVTVIADAPLCIMPVLVIGPLTATDNCGIATTTWTKTGATIASGSGDVNGTPFHVGVTTVTYTVTDIHGNSSNCSFAVTMRDQVPPTVITCPPNVTKNVDPNGCSAPVTVPAPVVVDPCGEIVSVTNSFNNTADASGIYPGGITVVTWTFTDESGNKSTCTQTITITDNIPPTFTSCPSNVVQTALPNNCALDNVIIPNPVYSDNCAVTLTWVMTGATTGTSPATGINYVSGQTFNVGHTLVTYTVTDISGNTATCSFDVWIKSLFKPVFSVSYPADIVQNADAGKCDAAVTVPVPLVSDPCNEVVSVVNSFNGTNNASGTYPLGVTTVTWTLTNESGNVTTYDQKITINDLLPTLTCPPNIVVNSDYNKTFATNVLIGTPVYADNCPGITLTWVSSNPTPGTSPITGINIDNVSTYNAGITTITYTLTDANNHTATCAFTVSILEKPVISCPKDTTRNNDPGLCSAAIDPGVPTLISGTPPVTWTWVMTGATSASGTGIPISPVPYTFNAGVTTITWTASNASGSDVCSQKITVVDNQPPTITCPADVTVTAAPPLCVIPAVVIPPLTATDNCSIATITWTKTGATTDSSPATGMNDVNGTSFHVGVTTVTYTVTDIHGLITTCSFKVTVHDQVPPTVITCPPDVTKNVDPNGCSAPVTVPAPVVTDPCGEIVSVTNSFNNTADASGIYPGGVTVVTWTFTDESGNKSTCSQTITITDNIPPTFTFCPPDVVQSALLNNCALDNVIIPNPTYSDNCTVTLTWVMTGATTGTSPATGINYVSGQTFKVGHTLVTYTVTDISGNKAICSFDVWIKSLFKPIFSVGCPADIVQNADVNKCDAAVTVPVPVVSDPCNELVSIVNSFNNTSNASGTYPIGTTVVTWTITNVSGNITTCVQNITINDLLPTLTCPGNIVTNADFNKSYASKVAIGTPVYADNCPGLTLAWVSSNPTPGASPLTGANIDTVSTYNGGVTTITYTLTDTNGHMATCAFTVTVLEKPVISCAKDTTRNNDSGLCSSALDPGLPTLISGATPVTWTWQMSGATTASGTGIPINPIPYIFNVGVTTIKWTATNASGSDVCSQKVTVADNEPPTFAVNDQSFCVENLNSAAMISNGLQINPDPDYYLFRKGNTLLDIDPVGNSFKDNCCANNTLEIHWRIDFTDTPNPGPPPTLLTFAPITGTGQPSAYTSDIKLPGDGVNFTSIVHKISYWLVDCNGNKSIEKVANITIRPRPEVN